MHSHTNKNEKLFPFLIQCTPITFFFISCIVRISNFSQSNDSFGISNNGRDPLEGNNADNGNLRAVYTVSKKMHLHITEISEACQLSHTIIPFNSIGCRMQSIVEISIERFKVLFIKLSHIRNFSTNPHIFPFEHFSLQIKIIA